MTSIDEESLRLDILDDASDGLIGLYEIIWSLNYQYPEVAEDTKISVAQKVINQLFQEGLLELFESKWNSNDGSEIKVIHPDLVIANRLNWNAPTDRSIYFGFCAIDY